MKCENSGKENLVKNCQDGMSLILQIRPKTLNSNMGFRLHYETPNNPFKIVSMIVFSNSTPLVDIVNMADDHVREVQPFIDDLGSDINFWFV